MGDSREVENCYWMPSVCLIQMYQPFIVLHGEGDFPVGFNLDLDACSMSRTIGGLTITDNDVLLAAFKQQYLGEQIRWEGASDHPAS